MPKTRPTVLTIVGHDPSGGAGLLADIKTFEANKVYGMGVVTALTWQNESEFERVEWLSVEKIISQIEILLRKSKVEYAKIGLVENAETLKEIVDYLKKHNEKIRIIWDPILKASAGFDFHSTSSLEVWQNVLPDLFIISPNSQEATWLSGGKIGLEAGEYLSQQCNVFLKGGHNAEKLGYDYLFSHQSSVVSRQSIINRELRTTNYEEKAFSFKPKVKNVPAKHGSGCVLSSAITAYLARGYNLQRACLMAKNYVTAFLLSNEGLLGWHKI